MSGAISFVLGLLGLGTSGAINAGEHMSQAKKIAEYERRGGWDATGERAQMYDRVRKEWMDLPYGGPNCVGKWPSEYPTGRYLHSRYRSWFKAHLDAKGIPYDDIILDQVSGVNGDITRIKMLDETIHGRKPRHRIF